ncbi:MAG: VOC family protein [Capnocytophaga sp.]|nr:VOC family protein [Capnocytophaga sp.]
MANTINPYLNFDGNCEEAFNFYKKAFGGEFTMISRANDNPVEVSQAEKNHILFIELPIGGGKLMGSDVFKSFGHTLVVGNNNYVSIAAESKAEADRLFTALSENGEIEMPIGDQFFGYFGSFQDQFGVRWMVSFMGQ